MALWPLKAGFGGLGEAMGASWFCFGMRRPPKELNQANAHVKIIAGKFPFLGDGASGDRPALLPMNFRDVGPAGGGFSCRKGCLRRLTEGAIHNSGFSFKRYAFKQSFALISLREPY